jgi:hypothetical protein
MQMTDFNMTRKQRAQAARRKRQTEQPKWLVIFRRGDGTTGTTEIAALNSEGAAKAADKLYGPLSVLSCRRAG